VIDSVIGKRGAVSFALLKSCNTAFLVGLMAFWFFAPLRTVHADPIDVIKQLYEEQRFADLAKVLPQVSQSRPNHPAVLFLQAIMEKDAGRAAQLYERVAALQSEYADQALFRLAQYRYHLGQYDECRQTNVQMIKGYPGSSLIDDAVFLYGQTLLAKGEIDSARAFLKSFIKRYPHSPYVDVAVLDLESSQLWQQQEPQTVSDFYRIQIGAFEVHKNAQQIADRMAEQGFEVEIYPKERLYAVLIGRFLTRSDAEAFAHQHRHQFDFGYHIVNLRDR